MTVSAPLTRPLVAVPEPPAESTWRKLDLTDALSGKPPEPPEVLRRSDGKHLLYRGRIHWIQGEPESGKSWVSQAGAAQALNDGHNVLYIDFEDDANGVVERLLALGVKTEAIRERFDYRTPHEPLYDRHGAATPAGIEFEDDLEAGTYEFAVIDGVTESLAHHATEIQDNTGVATWANRLPKRVSALTGAAVICIDHVTKSTDGRQHFAIGAQQKLAAVDGAAYGARMVRPFGRALEDQPITGQLELTLSKDRRGWLRGRYGKGDVVAVVEVTSWPDGRVDLDINPPPTAGAIPRDDVKLQADILAHLTVYDGLSKTKIETEVTGNAKAIRDQLKALEARQFITIEQKGQSHRHWLTDEGREWLADV